MTIHLMRKSRKGKTYCGKWEKGDLQGGLSECSCLNCLKQRVLKSERKLVKLRKMWEELIKDLKQALRF